MKNINKQLGFSAVELLITLFIAAAFLISGYQLYAVVIKDGGEARQQNRANNVANEYLQTYKSNTAVTNPCSEPYPQPMVDETPDPAISGLSNVKVSVDITCPYEYYDTPEVSKVSVTVKYGNDDPQLEVTNATYVTP